MNRKIVMCQYFVEGEHAKPEIINQILFRYRLIMTDYYALGNAIESDEGTIFIDFGSIYKIDF